jgi:hypothetical protein
MNTLTNIIEIGIWTSVIFSILFVAIRVFVCYFYNPKDYSEDCSCQVGAINDQITDNVTVANKPKRKQVKKKVAALVDGKVAIHPIEDKPKRTRKVKTSTEPAKKKPARKKKES